VEEQQAKPAKRRKRSPEEARAESLAAARHLLMTEGPSAVTLANVGRDIGMSHTNIIHHFGSAGGLHGALMESMVRDLTVALDDVVGRVQTDITAPQNIINAVFDAFEQGGGGQLAAWLVLTREFDHLDAIRQAVNDLVTALSEKFPGVIDVEPRMRSAVLLIAISAFGDAVIGPHLRPMLGLNDDAMRTMVTRILPFFYLAG
jgi:TetR/AcrR family transcriptional regulator, repressor for neighboring sulfatase